MTKERARITHTDHTRARSPPHRRVIGRGAPLHHVQPEQRTMSSAAIKDVTELQAFEVVDKLIAAGLSSSKWRELGEKLEKQLGGESIADLEAIGLDKPTCNERLEKLIDEFVRKGGNIPWETLAIAVAECSGNRNIARNLLKAVGIDPDELDLFKSPPESDILSAKDAKEVFEEIKEAKRKAFALGVKLNLSASMRREINLVSLSPDERLLKTLEGYTNMIIPKPSWEGIATALESQFVGLPELANRIREKHCPGLRVITVGAEEAFQEIKEASGKVFALGLKLNLPVSERRRINLACLSPDERLLKTLEEYMKLINPKPSWEGIATALNDKFVGLPELAERIGRTHCPGWNVVEAYEDLKASFKEFIKVICEAIEVKGIALVKVAGDVDELVHSHYDKGCNIDSKYMEYLYKSEGIEELFRHLGRNWDCLHPEMYIELMKKLSLTSLNSAKSEYLGKWATFLNKTPLTPFCEIPEIERKACIEPPSGFFKCVKKLNWEPPPKFLRDVEDLRMDTARKCNIQSCAVTVVNYRKGCVEITMWVPKSTELCVARDIHFIKKHRIIRIVFNGIIVYSQVASEVGSSVDTVRKIQVSKLRTTLRFIMKTLYGILFTRVQKHLKVATPLKEACTRRDLVIARVLLEAGADPNLVTDDWTPLMEAAKLNNREMIQLLVEFGANPNTTNGENWTALMAASNNGQTEAVDQLLQSGADPNLQDHVGWSAPLASVFKKHEEIALRLTEAGANPHLQNCEYQSPLRLAIGYKQYTVVDAFLDTHPDVKPGLRGHPELDSKDKYEETDLLFACKENDLRVVRKILRKGADPNIKNINEDWPLVSAAENGNNNMLGDLLKFGADPNLTTKGKSPLSVAAQKGNTIMVIELLRARANPNFFTDKGTPLATAAKLGNIEMVQYMLDAGADPNIAEFADQLPLYRARRLDDKQMIQLLIDYGADPEKEAKLPGKVVQLAMGFLKGPLAD